MSEKPTDPTVSTPVRKTITAGFGVFFIMLAGLVAYVANPQTIIGSVLVGLGLFLMGVDLIVSAWRGTRSFTSRIGPLP